MDIRTANNFPTLALHTYQQGPRKSEAPSGSYSKNTRSWYSLVLGLHMQHRYRGRPKDRKVFKLQHSYIWTYDCDLQGCEIPRVSTGSSKTWGTERWHVHLSMRWTPSPFRRRVVNVPFCSGSSRVSWIVPKAREKRLKYCPRGFDARVESLVSFFCSPRCYHWHCHRTSKHEKGSSLKRHATRLWFDGRPRVKFKNEYGTMNRGVGGDLEKKILF